MEMSRNSVAFERSFAQHLEGGDIITNGFSFMVDVMYLHNYSRCKMNNRA